MRVRNRNTISVFKKYENQPRWWDCDCVNTKHRKYSLLRRFRWTSDKHDFSSYKTAGNQFKSVCKSKQSVYEKQKQEELVNSKSNPKLFWSLVKSNNSFIGVTDNISAENWKSYFQTLLYKDNQRSLTDLIADDDLNNDDEYASLNLPITDDEINRNISKLKCGKSQGIDGIGAEFYKHTSQRILPILNALFNKILSSGEFPNMWSESLIVPIHKSGSINDPSNYKGISLINIMYKIF